MKSILKFRSIANALIYCQINRVFWAKLAFCLSIIPILIQGFVSCNNFQNSHLDSKIGYRILKKGNSVLRNDIKHVGRSIKYCRTAIQRIENCWEDSMIDLDHYQNSLGNITNDSSRCRNCLKHYQNQLEAGQNCFEDLKSSLHQIESSFQKIEESLREVENCYFLQESAYNQVDNCFHQLEMIQMDLENCIYQMKSKSGNKSKAFYDLITLMERRLEELENIKNQVQSIL